MPGTIPNPVWVFRIVHIDNIEFILKHGMFTKGHPDRDLNYINIGLPQIQMLRATEPVRLPNCGSLADYVPFYFGRLSPMLLKIKTGHGGVAKRPQAEIVYVCCKLDRLRAMCSEIVFTDGQANQRITRHFKDFDYLSSVDWELVNERYWSNNEEDRDRERRKQAEVLIRSHVPPECIGGLIVLDTSAEKRVKAILTNLKSQIPVKIRPDYYYH